MVLLTAATALAQATGGVTQATPRVEGAVRDARTGQPIAGARVTLYPGPNYRYGQPGLMTTESRPDGGFTMTVPAPGPYIVNAVAEGYLPEGAAPRPIAVTTSATLTLLMVRQSSLEGRIVDADRGDPIAGVRMIPNVLRYQRGQLIPGIRPGLGTATTDSDGVFRFEGMVPGSYVFRLEIAAEQPKIHIGVNLEDIPSPDVGYGNQWWPGGASPTSEGAVQVVEGARIRLPDIRIARRRLLRLSGSVRPDQCNAGDKYRLSIFRFFGTALGGGNASFAEAPPASVPCETPFVVDRLSPAEYRFAAAAEDAPPADARVVNESVPVFNDVERDFYPMRNVTVTGMIELPEAFPPDARPRLAFRFSPIEGSSSSGPVQTPAERFQTNLPPNRSFYLTALGLPPPYYVSKVTYSGAPVVDAVLTVQPYSPDQTIKITISADGGSIEGTVSERGEPAPRAAVLAVPWPIRSIGGFPVHYFSTANEQGRYAVPSLPPGDYRVLAVPLSSWEMELQKPGLLSALASSGSEIALTPSGSVRLPLELKSLPVSRW
ncbi:MAG TPA: carboxypeptidase regulatory-like domain-containing protein [Terriglobia bacterium]|nr:carboxypeptidase regulatory-like domain-containing protein [Terriglobia bacterium]